MVPGASHLPAAPATAPAPAPATAGMQRDQDMTVLVRVGLDAVEQVEPRLGARAVRAVAALADDDAEGVVPTVVRAHRGGEARAAGHAEGVPVPAGGGGGGAPHRTALGLGSLLGADDDLVTLAAVVRAAAVAAEGGGAGHAEAVLPAAGGEVLRDEPPDPGVAGLEEEGVRHC